MPATSVGASPDIASSSRSTRGPVARARATSRRRRSDSVSVRASPLGLRLEPDHGEGLAGRRARDRRDRAYG